MNLGIVVLEYARAIRTKKKSIDGITWSFSTFRNSADLLCLDLTNWSNLQIITLQFADLNRNNDFFFGQAVYMIDLDNIQDKASSDQDMSNTGPRFLISPNGCS